MSGERASPPNRATTSRRDDKEDVMRGTLTLMLGAIGVCLSAFTPSPDVVPNDVYAWRWTIDTILDAQKNASRRDTTLPATAPNESKEPS
jgi:hypothetical protein